jgi:hypothetical protein
MLPGREGCETEILDLERRYWQAMREQDVRTALALTR